MGPTATAAVTEITDDFGSFQGIVSSGTTTDDTSLSISGTLSADLADGEAVRIYDGIDYQGDATVSGTSWSFDDIRVLSDSQSVSYTAKVADANGNLSTAGSAYTATVVVCFLAGTLISTPDGERPIESLKPGDLFTTAQGPGRCASSAAPPTSP
jgi:hypothetical protein